MPPERPRSLLERVAGADVDEDVLRALSRPPRRYVLYHLLDADPAALEDLAASVAGWMTAAHAGVDERVDRDSLRTALYHSHLPVLEDAGLVAVSDDRARTVAPTLSPAERELVEATYVAEHRVDPGPA